MLLALEDVTTYYGQMRILEGISLHVDAGELVCLLGGNASGKSTTLKTVLGIVRPRCGAVLIDGEEVNGVDVPTRIARGLAIVPENRRLFGQMTVRENLELGAMLRRRRGPRRGLRARPHSCSRACTSAASSSPARCRAASSRWWRWAAR